MTPPIRFHVLLFAGDLDGLREEKQLRVPFSELRVRVSERMVRCLPAENKTAHSTSTGRAIVEGRPLSVNRGKAPRNFQAPTPSRTLQLAPYWAGWSKAMRGHSWSVKGMSVESRTKEFIEHSVHHGISLAGGGDISGWEMCWGAEIRTISAWLDRTIMRQEYARISSDVFLERAALSRQVRFVFEYLHASGESDNSGSNGNLHMAILAAAFWVVLGGNIVTDPKAKIKVEGDDSTAAHPLLKTQQQGDRIAQFFIFMGLQSDFEVRPIADS